MRDALEMAGAAVLAFVLVAVTAVASVALVVGALALRTLIIGAPLWAVWNHVVPQFAGVTRHVDLVWFMAIALALDVVVWVARGTPTGGKP